MPKFFKPCPSYNRPFTSVAVPTPSAATFEMASPLPSFKMPMGPFMGSMDMRRIVVVTLWIRIIGKVIIRVGIGIRIGIAVRIVFLIIARIRYARA
jgi:hypothetical protein